MDTVDFSAILRLSVDERISLVTAIWDSIVAEDEPPALTDEQVAEIERRIADHRQNPGLAIPAGEVFAELRKRCGASEV